MQHVAVRFGLLAVFADGPKYRAQVGAEFESRTGGTWPLNVGQVYQTLDRLRRDGMLAPAGSDEAGRDLLVMTDAGRQALHSWFDTPLTREDRPRSELAIKLVMATTTPGQDVAAVVQRQRTETMRQLRDYTTLQRGATDQHADAWLLLLDFLIFAAEAEIRWLDHMEATVLRRMHAVGPAVVMAPVPHQDAPASTTAVSRSHDG